MFETPAYVVGRTIRINPYHFSLKNGVKHIINTSRDDVHFRDLILQKYGAYVDEKHLEIKANEDGFLDCIREMYKLFGAEAGTDNHIIGTMYLGNFLFEKYVEFGGIFGFETVIQRASTYEKTHKTTHKMVRPDLFYISPYDKGIIAEIQNNGRMNADKAKLLKVFSDEVDNLSRIYVGFKECNSEKDTESLIDDLCNALTKYDMDLSSVTLCFFPSTPHTFLDAGTSNKKVARMVKEKKLH